MMRLLESRRSHDSENVENRPTRLPVTIINVDQFFSLAVGLSIYTCAEAAHLKGGDG
jgi:hypothetical protein